MSAPACLSCSAPVPTDARHISAHGQVCAECDGHDKTDDVLLERHERLRLRSTSHAWLTSGPRR